jgi:hypothetical protein
VKAFYAIFKEVKLMQAAELTIANSSIVTSSALAGSAVGQWGSSSFTGKLDSLMARVFGCRHVNMSRPFSRDGRAYRSCLNCGAQRQFNLGNWKMQGGFYYGKPQMQQTPSA